VGERRWWTGGAAAVVGQTTDPAVHGGWPIQTGGGVLDSAADSLTQ